MPRFFDKQPNDDSARYFIGAVTSNAMYSGMTRVLIYATQPEDRNAAQQQAWLNHRVSDMMEDLEADGIRTSRTMARADTYNKTEDGKTTQEPVFYATLKMRDHDFVKAFPDLAVHMREEYAAEVRDAIASGALTPKRSWGELIDMADVTPNKDPMADSLGTWLDGFANKRGKELDVEFFMMDEGLNAETYEPGPLSERYKKKPGDSDKGDSGRGGR